MKQLHCLMLFFNAIKVSFISTFSTAASILRKFKDF
jgi:hypothetical protein